MKIAMFTNTYLPHVGGVARSVSVYATMYRELGHECLVFAPEFDGDYEDDPHVVRLPAITNFNNSGFSVRLPAPGVITESLDEFEPDVIHSHHPFLAGDAALRVAYGRDLPLIFTHHTLYERYTNYLPFHGDFTQRAAAKLATTYANACDLVFAPSQSVAKLIRERGVETEVVTQPTGIDLDFFAGGKGTAFRRRYGIPETAFVLGHVGRLAAEKNLGFLAEAAMDFMRSRSGSLCLFVGGGDEKETLEATFQSAGLKDRLIMTGPLQGGELADAYAACDVFGFTSTSETQGLVLVEAMASGTPVVALDGPGVRDVVQDGSNGALLPSSASAADFAQRLLELMDDAQLYEKCSDRAKEAAAAFSNRSLAERALGHYQELVERSARRKKEEEEGLIDFESLLAVIEGEFELLKVRTAAAVAASGLMDEDRLAELE